MQRSFRVCLATALVCVGVFLTPAAHSQIEFKPNLNLYDSPAVVPCKAAISAKIQTDHNASVHFENNTTITRDTSGNTRVQGKGDYLPAPVVSFTFTCVFGEHSKAVVMAFYTDYAIDGERLVSAGSQAQDCQEKTVARVYASEGYSQKVSIIPRSIVSTTKKNGDRIIYGDGAHETGPFRFNCTYRDGRLTKFDYFKETGPLYGGAVKPPPQIPDHPQTPNH